MKNEIEDKLNRMQMPEPEKIIRHDELKIPVLSYKMSSKAGLWLLLLPLVYAIIFLIKMELGVQSGYIDFVQKFFAAIDNNVVLTFLIPVIFIGLPLFTIIINILAICHFQYGNRSKELVITIKHRIWNIVIILISFAILVFFLLPDRLSF